MYQLNQEITSVSQNVPISESEVIAKNSSLVNRRGMMATMLGAGAALLAGGNTASALFFRRPASTHLDLKALPAKWVEMQGRNISHYQDFLAGLKLEKITVQQIISAHAKQKGGVWNHLPPSSIWKNIATTLRATDRIARELNQPVKEIISAYRAPAYNSRCAGARRSSWHKTNCAIDVTFPVRASIISQKTRELRNRGLFKGGVGSYSTFTHIDCRGMNIDW